MLLAATGIDLNIFSFLLSHKIFLVIICALNLLTFIIYGADKFAAIKGKWRVKELHLLALAFIGGSFGALFGMLIFRHKIRKPHFVIGVPLFLLMNIGALVLLINLLAC